MQCVKGCKFRISNVPENVPLGSICSLFGQFSQLKEFGVQEVSSTVYVISMKSSSIVEIEAQCDVLAYNFKFTMAWIESQRQVAVIGGNVEETMPKLTSPPRKKCQIISRPLKKGRVTSRPPKRRRVTSPPPKKCRLASPKQSPQPSTQQPPKQLLQQSPQQSQQQLPQMQSYKFIISDVPKGTSYYDIYSALSSVGRINTFAPMYPQKIDDSDQYISYTYNITIQTTNIDKLEHHCANICEQFKVKIDRLISFVQTPEDENEQNANQSLLQTPPERQSPLNILNALDGHCLREIFERPEIDLNDLAAIANTCQQFKSIVEEAFAKKYVEDFTKFKHTHLWRVEEFLRTFGEQITSISFADENADDRLEIMLRMILKSCINVTKLECSVFHEHSRIVLRGVLPKLQELTIIRPSEQIVDIFDVDAVHQIKKLRFVNIRGQLKLPSIKMPSLVDLRLDNRGVHTITSLDFFSLNPQIEMLVLGDNGHISNCSYRILDYLSNVKNLEMSDTTCERYREESLALLTKLKHLKTLRIRVNQMDRGELIAAHILQALQNGKINLETLSLEFRWFVPDIIIDSLCRFKNIKSLNIENKSHFAVKADVALSRVVRVLKKLECIHGERMATLNGIRNALKTAKRLKKAYFLVILEIKVDDSTIIPDLHLVEIDAIRQKKGIDLCIDIQAQLKGYRGYKLDKIREELVQRCNIYGDWVTFTSNE